jgi:hypothetical protein
MKLKGIAVLLIIILSLLPAYYINLQLLKFIEPRKAPVRFLSYMLSVFAFIFIYTFLIVWLIGRLFPVK